jgi:predicted PurR-regulated permease PerM
MNRPELAPTRAASESTPDLDRAGVEPMPHDDVPAARMSVDARGVALAIIAGLGLVYTLSWAEDFLVPLLIGIVVSYALSPLVTWLEAIRIPRAIGAVVVIASVIGMLGVGTYSLRGQMQTIIEGLPNAATRVADGLARLQISQIGNMRLMQQAATKMEQATQTATPGATKQPAAHVIIDPPAFKLGQLLWGGSIGALAAMGQAAMIIFLVFFLLVGGDTFKRKLVRLTGPSLTKRKITVHILDDINGSIQKYMLMLLTTNMLVALLSWIAFRLIGLDNPGAWAFAAALLHIVPYLGPAVTAIATGTVAFAQFDSLGIALLVAGASLAIATLIGTFVTTWMTGRIANMNPAAVFISLLFWGWMWGVWGMLLSIPIIVIIKVVSQHVEQLHPIAELLGD